MVDIPINDVKMNDYENVVKEVLNQLITGQDKYGDGAIGTAYIDWGATSEIYKNCPSKSIADRVAYTFKEKGYFVYIQRMGRGNRRVPEGTPIIYRIYKNAKSNCSWEEL